MATTRFPDAAILLADNEEYDLFVMERMLRRAGYRKLITTMQARDVERLALDASPDLIVLDLHMPLLDSFALIGRLAAAGVEGLRCPILIISADGSPRVRCRSLSVGARDFLMKPFDTGEALLRIHHLLEAHYLHRELLRQNTLLEHRVRERTQELEWAQTEILERLALAAEFRDDTTGRHTDRVGRIAARLAVAMGFDADAVELIRAAAPLHDVGKIAIPDHILLKPALLTREEFAIVKTHTVIGARMLSGSHFPVLQQAEQIALTHHERWDGDGYTSNVSGAAIPISGRLVAVADVFDALTHERPYKRAWPMDKAVAEIARQRGRQFDPEIVDAFMAVASDLEPEAADTGPLRRVN